MISGLGDVNTGGGAACGELLHHRPWHSREGDNYWNSHGIPLDHRRDSRAIYPMNIRIPVATALALID